jgi:TonB family protein
LSRIRRIAPLALLVASIGTFSAQAEERPARVITQPDWIKRPRAEDLVSYYPAAGAGVSAKVKLTCLVTSRGTLDGCSIAEESPPGHGFGQSALMMAPLFLMRPKTVDGAPVGGATITIPINFGAFSGAYQPTPTIQVINNPAWADTPSAQELAAAFPSRAAGRVERGRSVQRCRMTSDGHLSSCETITEQPSGQGFAAAARRLTKSFRVLDDPGLRSALKRSYIDVPFEFRDPGIPGPPVELVDPEWLTGASGEIFPFQAAKAGVTTGLGVLRCDVTHEGRLAPCAVVRETPEGLGFGRSALAVAGAMRMNPWMKQGFPVEGASITLPIRLNLDPARPTPSTAESAQ